MQEMSYQIASRATILLGREGVSRSDGALIELIKNSYDADANFCFVYFDRVHDRIVIIDDGMGMTQDVISKAWMTIGTDNKKASYVSQKRRIKSGEKGIGRFALDRLGKICRMYTKHQTEKLISWEMDWSLFEKAGQMLSEVKARYEYLDEDFEWACEQCVADFPVEVRRVLKDRGITLETGTILEISSLRDEWSRADIKNACAGLESLLPPQEQGEYDILVKQSESAAVDRLSSMTQDDFDYRLRVEFDGENFSVEMTRNELNVAGIPSAFFKRQFFKEHSYRPEDFAGRTATFLETIPSLMSSDSVDCISSVKKIGRFKFDIRFLKLTDNERTYCKGFHRRISPTRKTWMEQFAGIKIYRDNFAVRPYGDRSSNSFDWLGLDARKNINPVAVSHKSLQWHVSNAQVQGTLFISRIDNPAIADKSSREGVIENMEFKTLCTVLKNLISLFERDRAQVEREIKLYNDEVNVQAKVKQEATMLARAELTGASQGGSSSQETAGANAEQRKIYAKAIQYYREEIGEMASEIKMLRALATNGLITSSLVHDLKSVKALLVARVNTLRNTIQKGYSNSISRQLDDLQRDDEFLRSWITVITERSNYDRRKRVKLEVGKVVEESINTLKPILDKKHVKVKANVRSRFVRRIFRIDFESLIYNLLINSIEAFESTHHHLEKREVDIDIDVDGEDSLHIKYHDSGPGLDSAFKADPEKILQFGITSKVDKYGERIGSGLGMYIVSASVNEYGGKVDLSQPSSGFAIEIIIPGEKR